MVNPATEHVERLVLSSLSLQVEALTFHIERKIEVTGHKNAAVLQAPLNERPYLSHYLSVVIAVVIKVVLDL